MHALRFPFAASSGVLVTLAVFSLLWQLVSRPIELGDPTPAHRIDWTRLRKDTPPETKRPEKAQRTPPPVIPTIPHGIGDPTNTLPTEYVATQFVGPEIPKHGGFAVGQDRDAIPIVRVAPDYPAAAITNNVEGWVRVQFTITAAGTVKDAIVVDSQPKKTFDDAALRGIARWRYNPKVEGGVAVERVGLQTIIRFELGR